MFCPKCRDEFQEGYARCEKCDADLVEILPPAVPTVSALRWRKLFGTGLEKWIKIGALVYVATKILADLFSRSSIIWIDLPTNAADFLSRAFFLLSSVVYAIVQGLFYFAVGHLVGLFKGWAGEKGQGADVAR